MKKNYEKPVLTTEQFEIEDVITASAGGQNNGLNSANPNWEIPGLGLDLN